MHHPSKDQGALEPLYDLSTRVIKVDHNVNLLFAIATKLMALETAVVPYFFDS